MNECKMKKDANQALHVENFVNERILNSVNLGKKQLSMDERIARLNWYFDLSEAFHRPKGDGYKLVLICLH